MARPKGQFEQNKNKLLAEIRRLYCYYGIPCKASNEFFNEKVGVEYRQISRYLKALRDEKKIITQTKTRFDPSTNKYYCYRRIWYCRDAAEYNKIYNDVGGNIVPMGRKKNFKGVSIGAVEAERYETEMAKNPVPGVLFTKVKEIEPIDPFAEERIKYQEKKKTIQNMCPKVHNEPEWFDVSEPHKLKGFFVRENTDVFLALRDYGWYRSGTLPNSSTPIPKVRQIVTTFFDYINKKES